MTKNHIIQLFNNHDNNKRIKKYLNIFLTLVILGSLYTIYIIQYTNSSRRITQYASGISYETYKYGLSKCDEIKRIKPDNNYIQGRKRNPRYVPGTKDVLLKNARILDGIGQDFIGNILLKDGIISEITKYVDDEKHDVDVTDDTIIIDLKKKFVTPGLVDMHRYLYIFISSFFCL